MKNKQKHSKIKPIYKCKQCNITLFTETIFIKLSDSDTQKIIKEHNPEIFVMNSKNFRVFRLNNEVLTGFTDEKTENFICFNCKSSVGIVVDCDINTKTQVLIVNMNSLIKVLISFHLKNRNFQVKKIEIDEETEFSIEYDDVYYKINEIDRRIDDISRKLNFRSENVNGNEVIVINNESFQFIK